MPSGDQNFKCWSADLPSPTVSNRATTCIHIKNMHSWSLVGTILFGIGRSSAFHRPTIGQQSGDILGVGRPSTDDRTTGHRQKFILCTCLLHKILPLYKYIYKLLCKTAILLLKSKFLLLHVGVISFDQALVMFIIKRISSTWLQLF